MYMWFPKRESGRILGLNSIHIFPYDKVRDSKLLRLDFYYHFPAKIGTPFKSFFDKIGNISLLVVF